MSWNYRTPRCHVCYRPAYFQSDEGFHYCASHYSQARLQDEIAVLWRKYKDAGREAEYNTLLEATPDGRGFYLNFRDTLKANLDKPEQECHCQDLPDGRAVVCQMCRERASHNEILPEQCYGNAK